MEANPNQNLLTASMMPDSPSAQGEAPQPAPSKLQQLKKLHPDYGKFDDYTLGEALRNQFYPKMTQEEFWPKVLGQSSTVPKIESGIRRTADAAKEFGKSFASPIAGAIGGMAGGDEWKRRGANLFAPDPQYESTVDAMQGFGKSPMRVMEGWDIPRRAAELAEKHNLLKEGTADKVGDVMAMAPFVGGPAKGATIRRFKSGDTVEGMWKKGVEEKGYPYSPYSELGPVRGQGLKPNLGDVTPVYRVSDKGAKVDELFLKPGNPQYGYNPGSKTFGGRLEDIYDNPSFFKGLPEAKDTIADLVIDPSLPGKEGSLSTQHHPFYITGKAPNIQSTLEMLGHEGQHIQTSYQKGAPGANVHDISPEVVKKVLMRENSRMITAEDEFIQYATTLDPNILSRLKALDYPTRENLRKAGVDEGKIDALLDAFSRVERSGSMISDISRGETRELYLRHADEIRARDTARNMGLSQEELTHAPLYEEEGGKSIPPEEWIIKDPTLGGPPNLLREDPANPLHAPRKSTGLKGMETGGPKHPAWEALMKAVREPENRDVGLENLAKEANAFDKPVYRIEKGGYRVKTGKDQGGRQFANALGEGFGRDPEGNWKELGYKSARDFWADARRITREKAQTKPTPLLNDPDFPTEDPGTLSLYEPPTPNLLSSWKPSVKDLLSGKPEGSTVGVSEAIQGRGMTRTFTRLKDLHNYGQHNFPALSGFASDLIKEYPTLKTLESLPAVYKGKWSKNSMESSIALRVGGDLKEVVKYAVDLSLRKNQNFVMVLHNDPSVAPNGRYVQFDLKTNNWDAIQKVVEGTGISDFNAVTLPDGKIQVRQFMDRGKGDAEALREFNDQMNRLSLIYFELGEGKVLLPEMPGLVVGKEGYKGVLGEERYGEGEREGREYTKSVRGRNKKVQGTGGEKGGIGE